MKIERPLVAIECTVYNHEPYLRQCLDGIVNQKTTFSYIAIVHDDASTDKSAEIIKEYSERYPEIIKPIYQSENQYSKPGKVLQRFLTQKLKESGAKYIAWCEGDDYWIDPLKLQKQVDFMESHPDYSLYFHNAHYYNEQLKQITHSYDVYPISREVPAEDIIKGGGGFCPSCSLFYRAELMEDYPEFARNYHIGDLPLQIYLAIKGKVHYSSDIMGVYRIMVPGSWTMTTYNNSRITRRIYLLNNYRRLLKSLIFLDKFNEFSNGRYHEAFESKKQENINKHVLYIGIRKRLNLVIPRNKHERTLYYIVKFGLFPVKIFLSNIKSKIRI